MSSQEPISPEKLQRRREELRQRKYSFIELIMQVKKKLYKEKLEQERQMLAQQEGAD